MTESVFITDFDGTITAQDFYRLAVERLLPPEALYPWQEYRDGKITHFQALQRIFCQIQAPERDILKVVDAMGPSPGLAQSVAQLREQGWKIIVASAGCSWYIDYILGNEGVELEVHSNPGRYCDGALCMEAPVDSPFYSPETGVDKLGVVRSYLQRGARVAYAGDGFTDIDAALAVDPDLRFARGDLADSLREKGEPFHPFRVWSEVAEALLQQN